MSYTRDDVSMLYKLGSDMYDKYAYFLLAATGAAIGFGLQKLDGVHLSAHSATGVLAIVLWVVSFYLGLMRIESVLTTVRMNTDLAQLGMGTHPKQPPPTELQETMRRHSARMEKQNSKNVLLMTWQFRTLVSGVVLFVAWRLIQMTNNV